MSHTTLPATGLVRLHNILAPKGPLPISRSTWWAGIRIGRYPAPVKLGPRITAWRVEDIRALIEHPSTSFSPGPSASSGKTRRG